MDAVRSATGDTYPHFELLIADDGSTDSTPDIARAWACADSRIRVLQQNNRGCSAARNLAMAHARGRYFALLDSDDVWHPEFLASQLALFDRHPDVSIITGNGYFLGGPFDGRPLYPLTPIHQTLSLLDIIRTEDSVCIMSVFRREVYDRIGGFDETLTHNEDYDFWIRAAHAGFGFLTN